MPVYVFRCSRCGTVFERDVPMSEQARTYPCINGDCGGGNLARRVYTAPGVQFKGPGFYSTDSRGG